MARVRTVWRASSLLVVTLLSSGCFPRCQSDADCPQDGVFCNGEEFCNIAAILAGLTFCESGVAPCSNPTPVCNEVEQVCEACRNATDCDDSLECTVDACVETGCANTPQSGLCSAGKSCHPSEGCISAECATDADCPETKPFCPNGSCQVCATRLVEPFDRGCTAETPWCDCVEYSTCDVLACYECVFDRDCGDGTCVDRECQ